MFTDGTGSEIMMGDGVSESDTSTAGQKDHHIQVRLELIMTT